MPFKHYHGRTGVVFNVTKRAIGVTVNKSVNGRIIPKQIHVSVPHAKPSTCQKQIIERRKENERIKAEIRANGGEKVNLKRENTQPKAGYFYTLENIPETIQPVPYVGLI